MEPAPCSEGKVSPSAAPESRPETSRTGSGSSSLSPAEPRGGGWLGGSWESNNVQLWTRVCSSIHERKEQREKRGRERERERGERGEGDKMVNCRYTCIPPNFNIIACTVKNMIDLGTRLIKLYE